MENNFEAAQNTGKYWGPNSDGAVDTGMSSGNGLAAIEAWLAHEAEKTARPAPSGHRGVLGRHSTGGRP
jgi:hypothetical protein